MIKFNKIPRRWRRIPKYVLSEQYSCILPELQNYEVYVLGAELQEDGRIIIDAGYRWDGPSGPTFDTLNWMRASLVHDCLGDMLRYGGLPNSEMQTVHDIMRRMLIEDGMCKLRAWWSWKAVSIFAHPRLTK